MIPAEVTEDDQSRLPLLVTSEERTAADDLSSRRNNANAGTLAPQLEGRAFISARDVTGRVRTVTRAQYALESQKLLAAIDPLVLSRFLLKSESCISGSGDNSFGNDSTDKHARIADSYGTVVRTVTPPGPSNKGNGSRRRKIESCRACLCTWKTLARLGVLAVLVVGLTLLFSFVDVNSIIQKFLEWMQTIGVWGGVAFVGVYIIGVVLLIPGVFLTLSAGFVWGIWIGSVLVWLGASIGANVAFVLGRSVFSHWGSWASNNFAKVALIERVIAKNGWKFILLLRVSPLLPYAIMNYTLSLAQIRHSHYAIATSVGMVPGVFLYVYIGSLARSFTDVISGDRSVETGREAILICGGVVTLVAVVLLTVLAAREIRKEMAITATLLLDPGDGNVQREDEKLATV